MDKYPLIGVSIIAVVLLVLGSLTNVVGYQSVKSSGVNESPLYSVRTKRAISENSKDTLISNYLGKGKENLLQFPPLDNKTESLNYIFESMKKMDDATFQRFLILIKQRLKETTSLNELQLHEINDGLTELREQADLPVLSPSQMHTYGCPSAAPNCLRFFFLYLIIFLLIYPFCVILHSLFPGTFPSIW